MYVQSGSLFLLSVLSKALYLSFHLLFSGGSGKTFSHDNDTGTKNSSTFKLALKQFPTRSNTKKTRSAQLAALER